MPTIAAGVDFETVAREWRCKWSSDDDMASLKACQKLLDDMKDDILSVTYDWNGKQLATHEVLNGKIDVSKKQVQRLVDSECLDFKVIIKLPQKDFDDWQNRNFAPEDQFLQGLRSISGVSQVEAQTYSLEVMNLMGPKIKVPKAENGCMAKTLPGNLR
eukprot:TRINITY_DN24731_c0_g1_i1.p1 TRINITY_DN24731_c0_g1~~TRINITY_DN24731_c0_g1_i1.p1  ORF type:complete len:159 (-),score=33.90 TRINITY_DN24731_c0_g1_i1:150-626(-)